MEYPDIDWINYSWWENQIITHRVAFLKTLDEYQISRLVVHVKHNLKSNEISNNEGYKKTLEIIEDYLNKQKKETRQKQTYQWQGDAEKDLPKLYIKMNGRFIDERTTLEQFKAIFTGQPIESESIKPVKWIASNRLLAYFLDQVCIERNWQAIAENGKLFLKKDGDPLTANDLAVALSDSKKFGKPKGYEEIDEIVKKYKKP
ncbi:MAG: hypothetical protein OEW87_10130 [Flavobacteriaceae bacterium]|nr:hypothetical protein [Flavobacteriaceae bacterium]